MLEQAATADPLDKSLQARLVRTLAATGHQAEALETYEAVRRQLADELEVDPDPELRAAQAAVLRPWRPWSAPHSCRRTCPRSPAGETSWPGR